MSRIYGASFVAVVYLTFVSTSILGDMLYWLVSKYFAGYAKLFFYLAILIIGFELVNKKKIVKSSFVILLSSYFFLSLLIGIYYNPINKEFFAHFSPFLLGIFAYSYGYRSESLDGKLISLIDKHSIISGYFLTVLVVIYYFFVKLGYIEYFGAGALFAYPIFYCVKKGFYLNAVLFYVANLFTGKRSVLLAITIVLIVYIYKKSNKNTRFIFTIVLIIFFVIILSNDQYLNFSFGNQFDRYLVLFQYLKENDNIYRAIDLASSGRLYDAIAVLEKLGDNLFNWIFGFGLGATFSVEYSFSEDIHKTHYSHVTPFSYLLLGGSLLLIIVYKKLFLELKYALKNFEDHLSMMVLYFIIIGFSGAIFFTDPFVWLFIGAFSARRLHSSSK